MVCPNPSPRRLAVLEGAGYTLIELMIVLVIMAIVAVIAFYGIGKFNTDQLVINAQKEFLNNLRAVQNEANNGAGGTDLYTVNVSNSPSKSYVITPYNGSGNTITLPPGITVAARGYTNLTLCFANPNLASYGNINQGLCQNCGAGTYFACGDGTLVGNNGNALVSFDFSNGTTTKTVVIEGAYMTVNRMYVQ